jgi:hypothetical protein
MDIRPIQGSFSEKGSNPILRYCVKRSDAFWPETNEKAIRSTRLIEIWRSGCLQPIRWQESGQENSDQALKRKLLSVKHCSIDSLIPSILSEFNLSPPTPFLSLTPAYLQVGRGEGELQPFEVQRGASIAIHL